MFQKIKDLFLTSSFLKGKSHAVKLAYVGMITALNIVANAILEFKTLDVQFSFTILFSIITGMLLGGILGFISVFLADLLGYLVSSWGLMYMPWVGLSVALMALISGVVFKFGKNDNVHLIIKCGIITLLTFILCTVLINSLGFYYYNKAMGFSTAVLDYASKTFGSNVQFASYLAYRLIFKGQIFNSIFNYVLLFLFIPFAKKLKLIF